MTEAEKKALKEQLGEMAKKLNELANLEQRKKQLEEARKNGGSDRAAIRARDGEAQRAEPRASSSSSNSPASSARPRRPCRRAT